MRSDTHVTGRRDGQRLVIVRPARLPRPAPRRRGGRGLVVLQKVACAPPQPFPPTPLPRPANLLRSSRSRSRTSKKLFVSVSSLPHVGRGLGCCCARKKCYTSLRPPLRRRRRRCPCTEARRTPPPPTEERREELPKSTTQFPPPPSEPLPPLADDPQLLSMLAGEEDSNKEPVEFCPSKRQAGLAIDKKNRQYIQKRHSPIHFKPIGLFGLEAKVSLVQADKDSSSSRSSRSSRQWSGR